MTGAIRIGYHWQWKRRQTDSRATIGGGYSGSSGKIANFCPWRPLLFYWWKLTETRVRKSNPGRNDRAKYGKRQKAMDFRLIFAAMGSIVCS